MPRSSPTPLKARPATVEDAVEIVRLARLMFESMGAANAGDESWQAEGRRHVRDRLDRDLAVFVVDHPEGRGRLVASAAGTIATRLPGPGNPTARIGYIQWVATEPAFRRQGLARAVMTSLLDWYEDRNVAAVELHATSDAESLYRSLGFWEGKGGMALRRRSWDPPDAAGPPATPV